MHPNLSPVLNAILERSRSKSAINLRGVEVGQKIVITLGEGEAESGFLIEVIKPAGSVLGEDAMKGRIIEAFLAASVVGSFEKAYRRSSAVGLTCFFVGSCTKNPRAPLGWTMLQFHTITPGRHLLFCIEDPNSGKKDNLGWIPEETTSSAKVVS